MEKEKSQISNILGGVINATLATLTLTGAAAAFHSAASGVGEETTERKLWEENEHELVELSTPQRMLVGVSGIISTVMGTGLTISAARQLDIGVHGKVRATSFPTKEDLEEQENQDA